MCLQESFQKSACGTLGSSGPTLKESALQLSPCYPEETAKRQPTLREQLLHT